MPDLHERYPATWEVTTTDVDADSPGPGWQPFAVADVDEYAENYRSHSVTRIFWRRRMEVAERSSEEQP